MEGHDVVDPVATAVATTSVEPHDVKPTTETIPRPANALTPPTSEEMNHDEMKQEHEDSELSELDLDDEDEDDIEPDHYWDGGRIPVFKPTMDQFRSFKKFVDKIDKYGMKSGIVKVIPPKEWRDSLPQLDEHVKRIKIKNPIMQEFNGTQGIYTQQNVEKQRSYTLPEWKALTEETQHQPPAKRGERRRNQEKVVRGAGAVRSRVATATPAADSDSGSTVRRKPGRPNRKGGRKEEPTADDPTDVARARSQQSEIAAESPAASDAKPDKKPRSRQPRGGGPGQAKSVTSRRLNNTAERVDIIDEAAFESFTYNIDDPDEYTPERCAELETHYWKSLGFNQPMYAADMPGSLFDETTESWNVAKLENLLDVLGTKVPGVNTAYLYMGMWKATFAWHLEDVDLYSINYIHFGAPKQWYSISQEDARKFEKAMKTVWPVDSKNCDQFLRHKTYLISPDVLQKQYGVKVNKLVHYEGEFVITFPYGYHSGYNIGYNCAESVNFATESWLDFGKIARKCNCEADNVWVNVFEIERKMRGEPTPEWIEETDDSGTEDDDGHLPSPPASVKGKLASKKRKRGPKQAEPKKKKKIRIKLRVPTREPCVMCPNDNPWEPLLPTDNGKKAHRSCASYTPETFIVHQNGKDIVCGVGTIDRARLELKCNFCRSRRGACFQCNAKKCTRAFHATCALAAGVQIDGGRVPTFGEDGTEYYDEGFDFRCRYHRPKMPKNATVESLEGNRRATNFAKELQPNDVIQAQIIGAEVFAGLVLENRPSELTVLVQVLPEGERVEVEWKYLCVLDPEESQRLKPSANAIPLPVGMNKSAVSISNRQDGVPTQDEQFHDDPGFKWQEFYNVDMPPQGYMNGKIQAPALLSVDFNGLDRLFHYIPTKSTDSKSCFSDRANCDEVASGSNFIERVQPKTTYQHGGGSRKSGGGSSRPAQTLPKQVPHGFNTNGTPVNEKPYMYRPKDQFNATNMWTIDQQALATQRAFFTDSPSNNRAALQNVHTPWQPSPLTIDIPDSEPVLRSFPTEQYYSSKVLPAAYPGEHSAFREAARRESQGSQTLPRPGSSLGASSGIHPPVIGTGPLPSAHPATYASSASRPTSSSASHRSPYIGALTPATTYSHMSGVKINEGVSTDLPYLENLRKYPYLQESFCRRYTSYTSPYLPSGGFNPAYQRLEPLPPHEPEPQHTSPYAHLQAMAGSTTQKVNPWSAASQLWDHGVPAENYTSSSTTQKPNTLPQAFGTTNPPHQKLQPPQPGFVNPSDQSAALPTLFEDRTSHLAAAAAAAIPSIPQQQQQQQHQEPAVQMVDASTMIDFDAYLPTPAQDPVDALLMQPDLPSG